MNFGILYAYDNSVIVGYTDSNLAGDVDKRKSIFGSVFFIGNYAFT